MIFFLVFVQYASLESAIFAIRQENISYYTASLQNIFVWKSPTLLCLDPRHLPLSLSREWGTLRGVRTLLTDISWIDSSLFMVT